MTIKFTLFIVAILISVINMSIMDGIIMNRLRFMAGKGKGVREELAS